MSVAKSYGLLHIPTSTIVVTSYGDRFLRSYLLHLRNLKHITQWKYLDQIISDKINENVFNCSKEEFEIIEL